MSWNMKRASLTQEGVRRLLTRSSELPQREKDKIIDSFTDKLEKSGYSRHQSREIVEIGLLGYARKWGKMNKRHRLGMETETSRRRKKLTGKASWYKNKEVEKKAQDKRVGRTPRTNMKTKDKENENKTKQLKYIENYSFFWISVVYNE